MHVNNLVQLNEQGLSMFPSGTWTSHKIEIIHSKIMCLVDLVGMIKHVWKIGYKHFFMIQYMGPPVHPATISLCYKIISECSHGWPHISKTLQKKKKKNHIHPLIVSILEGFKTPTCIPNILHIAKPRSYPWATCHRSLIFPSSHLSSEFPFHTIL